MGIKFLYICPNNNASTLIINGQVNSAIAKYVRHLNKNTIQEQ